MKECLFNNLHKLKIKTKIPNIYKFFLDLPGKAFYNKHIDLHLIINTSVCLYLEFKVISRA
ncbi:MAG TPA: hypothetical protein DCZ10_01935 [Pelotomaculum sp.]|nr:hypothetical protein [Pelotomaculum sp.]